VKKKKYREKMPRDNERHSRGDLIDEAVFTHLTYKQTDDDGKLKVFFFVLRILYVVLARPEFSFRQTLPRRGQGKLKIAKKIDFPPIFLGGV